MATIVFGIFLNVAILHRICFQFYHVMGQSQTMIVPMTKIPVMSKIPVTTGKIAVQQKVYKV